MYTYTVMDNFFRKILSWDVSENLSGIIRNKIEQFEKCDKRTVFRKRSVAE
jgi:hypothetical protein